MHRPPEEVASTDRVAEEKDDDVGKGSGRGKAESRGRNGTERNEMEWNGRKENGMENGMERMKRSSTVVLWYEHRQRERERERGKEKKSW